uniref:Uncharacterized protein n=1 Tax=Oryza brachyantha TaxID=4533 RepID=J3ND32_ORYBR
LLFFYLFCSEEISNPFHSLHDCIHQNRSLVAFHPRVPSSNLLLARSSHIGQIKFSRISITFSCFF